MGELSLSESPSSERLALLRAALHGLRGGGVLTVHLSAEDNPDDMVAQMSKMTARWDFQKHRLGDGSWLLHAKTSRKKG